MSKFSYCSQQAHWEVLIHSWTFLSKSSQGFLLRNKGSLPLIVHPLYQGCVCGGVYPRPYAGIQRSPLVQSHQCPLLGSCLWCCLLQIPRQSRLFVKMGLPYDLSSLLRYKLSRWSQLELLLLPRKTTPGSTVDPILGE